MKTLSHKLCVVYWGIIINFIQLIIKSLFRWCSECLFFNATRLLDEIEQWILELNIFHLKRYIMHFNVVMIYLTTLYDMKQLTLIAATTRVPLVADTWIRSITCSMHASRIAHSCKSETNHFISSIIWKFSSNWLNGKLNLQFPSYVFDKPCQCIDGYRGIDKYLDPHKFLVHCSLCYRRLK